MLKLQKVELLGFKSFADQTEIAFNGNGVAAVVGPNGCGKSNISDAVHWVLGEQSPRTLRSGRMQDVLFSGTPGRKATGLAEVRLTLLDPDAETVVEKAARAISDNGGDNGRTGHGITAFQNGGVITVARRLFASGESEYLLNERPCRLRDIQEIFLGTGLGPDSYAIIEQGRIGQILSAKPYERRALIEEAAGVTKFKAKRKLAWAKLESSKQNLARVSDILEEVTRQLHSLQRQAARARRYKELREQMHAQLRMILASRYRQKEEEATQTALELGLVRGTLQEQSLRCEEREREQQALHQLLERSEVELRQAAEERSNLRLEAERARGQIATQSQQAVYLNRRIEDARAEQAQIDGRRTGLDAERNECARLVEQLRGEKETLAAELRGLEERAKACQQEVEEKDRRREQVGLEMLETVGRAATLRNQVAQLEQFLNQTAKQLAQAEGQRNELETAEEMAVAQRDEAETKLRAERAQRESAAERRQELEESLREAKEEELRFRSELEELRTELAAQRARLRSLEEILAHHAYSTETVKRLFEAHSTAGGTATRSRFEAVGVLADFVDVEPAYERVVEEFLREELDYVVVKDWDNARQALQLLQTEVPGRATFLLEEAACATPKANGNGYGQLDANAPGILRSLASCVHFTNGFSGAARILLPKLERCYLVADAEAGRKLAAEHPDAYFLTPEGVWFQGALVSAGKADYQGPLALKRELRSLMGALSEDESATEEMVEALAQTIRRIDEQQTELQTLTQQEQDCEKRLVSTERDVQDAAAERERVAERLTLVSLESERLQQEAERARHQWAQDTYEIAQSESRRAEMEAEMTAIAAATARLKAEREEAQAREGELRERLAALEERQRAAASSLARLESSVEELTRRSAELERQCEEWAGQQADWEQERLRLQEQVVNSERRSEELASRVAALEASGEERRRRLAELEQELPLVRQELEATRERKSAAEIQLARLQSELEHLRETCRSELQVEIETLPLAPTEAPGDRAVGGAVFGTALERALDKSAALSAEELAAAEEQYRQVRAKLENLGPINMMALEEFEECRERHTFLERQRQDLLDSIRDTTQAIEEIDCICHQQFTEALEQIGTHFQRTFTQLFGGGQGMLRLMEAEDQAEAGIEIIAQPPGKRLQSVLLLSGGEKALAALALLLAIFRYKPSPFCILDEVDAPLDDANIGRFTQIVQEMSRETQFILITHSKRTMSIAPVMYGVTMQEPGVSKIVSVRFNGAAAAAPASPRALAEAVA